MLYVHQSNGRTSCMNSSMTAVIMIIIRPSEFHACSGPFTEQDLPLESVSKQSVSFSIFSNPFAPHL